jgi:hypothetical protein
MFDVSAANDVRVISLDCNINAGAVQIEVYTVPGGYVGNEGNPGGWTLAGSGPTTSSAADQPTPLPFALDIEILAGQTLGFYVTSASGAGFRYTNGPGTGTAAQNADLHISEGIGISYPFGSIYTPRIWNGTIYYVADPGTAYCFADGTGAVCPCGNYSWSESGCVHSGGVGGVLSTVGSTSVGSDSLRCTSQFLPALRPALLFTGSLAVNGGAGQPFGDGLLCAGGTIQSLGVQITDAAGLAEWGPGLASQGAFAAGETRHFQTWYRDPGSDSPCGTGFNLTNGMAIVLTP